MKLRLDLLEHLTAADILEEAAANQHRYKAEPSFSKTGTGYLKSATPEESQQEEVRNEALIAKRKARAAAAKKHNHQSASPTSK